MLRHHTQRRRPSLRSLALAAAGVLALSLATPGVAAAAGPTTAGGPTTAAGGRAATAPARAHLAVRPHKVHPGHHVLITGLIPTSGPRSCPAADPAIPTSTAALFPPDGFGPPATRNKAGRFRVRYPVPSTTPPGTYRIGVRCGGGNVGISATLIVH